MTTEKSAATLSTKIDNIKVRMYRIGTGDCFLLQFREGASVKFNLMIDCGCINGGREDFVEKLENVVTETGGVIDLLIVTHEHADHINGFQKVSDIFDKKIQVKKVWFAWTEADEPFANSFRREHVKTKIAINKAAVKLNQLRKDKAFEKMYDDDFRRTQILAANEYFIDSLSSLNDLNLSSESSLDTIKTMEDILKENKVIKKTTKVDFFEPGDVIEDLEGAEGVRFLILGPPKNNASIKREEIKGEGYEKRQEKSTVEMSFQNLLLKEEENQLENDLNPFDRQYELRDPHEIEDNYSSTENDWRKIDSDWLFSAGGLALRHQSSINNTSFVVAIQFVDSEKLLLFPGDAEHGSWLSWHDNINWTLKLADNKTKKVNVEYILQNTVFYKVSHHLSQNGTPKAKGLEMMTNNQLAAMVTLDFGKINGGWLNTMPNDLIGEELIRKTKGKIFFAGDRRKILKNIKTSRTSLSKSNLDTIEKLNQPFDGQIYIDFEVDGR
jgi:hypothetical protein